jgi:hypothetical protein
MSNVKQTEPTERELRPLAPNELRDADMLVRRLACRVPAGTQPEDLIDPKFWQHNARRMSSGSEIIVLAEDFSFEARLIVRYATKNDAHVSLVYFAPLQAEVKPEVIEGAYSVEFSNSAKRKWIVRCGDNIVSHGHETKEQAEEWLKARVGKLAA